MKKKFGFIFLILILLSGLVVSAYFSKEIFGNTHNITSNTNRDSIIEVGTFNDFVKAAYLYNENNNIFNSPDYTYDSSKRKTIELQSNISFTADVLFNSDCHIDLNGFDIDLCGYDFNIKNQYSGLIAIYNNSTEKGSIKDSGKIITNENDEQINSYGNIIIDCPNSYVDFKSDVLVSSENIKIVEVDKELVCNSAFELLLANISNTGINNFYDTELAINDHLLNTSCLLCNEKKHCIYTYTDLDFIYNYFAYDVEYTYTSANVNLLSNYGRIVDNSETKDVVLTVKISYDDYQISKDINVHIIKESDFNKASVAVLMQYLDKYYVSSENKYIFDKTIYLPYENTYFKSKYNYSVNFNDEDYTARDETPNNYFTVNGNVVGVNLNSTINQMNFSSSYNDVVYGVEDVPVLGQSSSNIDDNYSYAVNIVTQLYGNQITIRDKQVTTYTEVLLLKDVNLNGYTRLNEIKYELINNYENSYLIKDYTDTHQMLYVNKENPPYIGQGVYLSIAFDFKTGDDPIIQIPIIFDPVIDDDNAEGFDIFDPYYVYFNKEFIKATNSYSYESFNIPLSYNESYPIYTFLVYTKDADGKFVPVPSGLFDIKISDDKDFINFDLYTRTNININPYYINMYDTTYYFAYVPLSLTNDNKVMYWGPDKNYYEEIDSINTQIINSTNYKYISTLTIPGIVRYQCNQSVTTEQFLDKDLYKLIFDILYESTEYVDRNTFIQTNHLSRYIEKIDFSSTSSNKININTVYDTDGNASITDNDGEINDLKGLNLLTGIKELDFSNSSLLTTSSGTLDINQIIYISQITGLEILDLSNTKIYDRQQGTIGFPEGDNNGLLTYLSELPNLRDLDLSNNKIYDFTELSSFPSLKTVDVTNNTFQSTQFADSQLFGFLDTLFTAISNAIYGSGGAINSATFTMLESYGITVNGYTTPKELAEEIQLIVNAMVSLEYQDKLKTDLPINLIYDIFSKTPSFYGLKTEFEYAVDGNTVDFEDGNITFTYVGENAETATAFNFNINYTVSAGWFSEEQDVSFSYTYYINRY